MSVGPTATNPDPYEHIRRRINQLSEEIAQLSEGKLSPPEYYGEYLKRVLSAIEAPAGAVWLRTAQGNMQLQYQINMSQVGLDQSPNSREMHGQLLRQAAMKKTPELVWPQSGVGQTEGGQVGPGNPTSYVILIAPILVDKEVAGLVEVWQDPTRRTEAQQGFLNFMVRMASLASGYTRNHQLRQMLGQQQVWTELEAFTKQIHASLNPTEVSYVIANEGRRLLDADRVSVGLRQGPKCTVYAISGADVVEKRSNLVQLMRALFDAVLEWGERLVYKGEKDDTLPPKVNDALDAFLAESNSKLLVVMPLRDDREKNLKRPPRSVIMMECFEPQDNSEQMVGRMDVICRHVTSSLYNAAEYRRIPMRFIWLPLAKLQDGLGGKARTILTLIGVGVVALVMAMIFVPYPLKMEANGQLLPKKRRWVYSPVPGFVREILVKPNDQVPRDTPIIRAYDLQLAKQVTDLELRKSQAQAQIDLLAPLINQDNGGDTDLQLKYKEAMINRVTIDDQLTALRNRTNAEANRPGFFSIKAPIGGIVLTGDFRETLLNKYVQPNEPLMRIGDVDVTKPVLDEWEVVLKIPQKHIGQVLKAYGTDAAVNEKLDVDILLRSDPTTSYKGKLHRNKVSTEAIPNPNDQNESEPVVRAWVSLDDPEIPEESKMPPEMLVTGTEVSTRIRCGNYAMGYALFYGVWEFTYEKVIFPF